MYGDPNKGFIEVISGGMFTAKTNRLIELLDFEQRSGRGVICFRPKADTRTVGDFIKSRRGEPFPAVTVDNPEEIVEQKKYNTRVIGIDECQLFNQRDDKDEFLVVKTVYSLATSGIRVIIAGLDTDFRRQPFGPMANLMAIAQKVTKLSGVCAHCGVVGPVYTQRLRNGKPASYDDPIVIIGDADPNAAGISYEPRCLRCHRLSKK